jgi:hypothetical protein
MGWDRDAKVVAARDRIGTGEAVHGFTFQSIPGLSSSKNKRIKTASTDRTRVTLKFDKAFAFDRSGSDVDGLVGEAPKTVSGEADAGRRGVAA